jgi:hypothetical protein
MASGVAATGQSGHRLRQGGSASGARAVGCDGELVCGKKWVRSSLEKVVPWQRKSAGVERWGWRGPMVIGGDCWVREVQGASIVLEVVDIG